MFVLACKVRVTLKPLQHIRVLLTFSVDVYCRFLDGWWCHLGRKWLQMLVLTTWVNLSANSQIHHKQWNWQVAQHSVTSNSIVSLFWIRWVSFAAIILVIASQRVFFAELIQYDSWLQWLVWKDSASALSFASNFVKLSEPLETKYGSIVMTQKLNNHLQFWDQFPLCPKKKIDMSGQTSQVCSSFFDCDGVVNRVHPEQMDNKHCHQEPLQHLGETYKHFLNMRSTIWHAAMLGTFCKCSVFHQHNIILNFFIFFIRYNWTCSPW